MLVKLFATAVAAAQATSAASLLIQYGWDSPDTASYKANVKSFLSLGIFDGVVMRTYRVPSPGVNLDAVEAFVNDTKWEWSDFAVSLSDLQAAPPTKLRNFLLVEANPGNAAWFDDAAWANVANNFGLLARLAATANLTGLCFDVEPYVTPFRQFQFSAQASSGPNRAFAQFRAQARVRGQQVALAASPYLSSLTLFFFRLFSDMVGNADPSNDPDSLSGEVYGLLPAFVDGMLDVIPQLTIIDGNEQAYTYNSDAAFTRAFTTYRLGGIADFLAPEHQSTPIRIGHGIYLDGYVNSIYPPGQFYHIDLLGQIAAMRVLNNVQSAMSASDGVVWIYGEQGSFWPGSQYPKWTKLIPSNLSLALQLAKAPQQAIPGLLKGKGNQLTPLSFFTWQDTTSHGNFSHPSGSWNFTAAGVSDGVWQAEIPVPVNKNLLFGAKLVSSTGGDVSINLGFKDAKHQWLQYQTPSVFPRNGIFAGMMLASEVPAGAKYIEFLISFSGQRAQDTITVTDPVLVPLIV